MIRRDAADGDAGDRRPSLPGCPPHMLATTPITARETAGTTDLTEDDVFEILSNRRRRFVIHALKRAEKPLDVSELSTFVTAWELDVEPEEVRYEDRRNIHSTLRRTHLPKLEEKNVVTVDGETDVVEPTAALRDLDIYVDVLRGREIPWSQYYVGLAGVIVAVLLAVHVGVPGFAVLTPLGVSVFAVTVFTISAAAHHVIGRHTRLGSKERPPELRQAT